MPFDNATYRPIPEGHRRLLVLAEFLDGVSESNFNIQRWASGKHDCGYVACAVGWAATIPEFQRLGLHMGETNCPLGPIFGTNVDMNAARAFFHLDISGCDPLAGEAVHLFHAFGYRDQPRGPQDVAARIRTFVAEQAKVLT